MECCLCLEYDACSTYVLIYKCNLMLEFLTLKETNFLQGLKEFSFYDTIYTSNIDFEDFNAIWIHLKAFYA